MHTPLMQTKTTAARSATGIAGLDNVLGGGLPTDPVPGRRQPGAGKTTLALQFLLEGGGRRELPVRHAVRNRDELRAVAASHGWSLDGIEIVELSPDESELEPRRRADDVPPVGGRADRDDAQGPGRRRAAASPQRVVFDSLSEMRLLAQNSLRYRRQILALKQFFVGRDCTVLLLDDRTADGPDCSCRASRTACCRWSTAARLRRERRRLQVVKFRGSDFRGGFHDFMIRTAGSRCSRASSRAEHRVEFKREQSRSGVRELDALLGGGIDRGTGTLLVGAAGHRQVDLALQFAAAAAQRGDHAAMFSFDESRKHCCSRAAAASASACGADIGPGTVSDPADRPGRDLAGRVRACCAHGGGAAKARAWSSSTASTAT